MYIVFIVCFAVAKVLWTRISKIWSVLGYELHKCFWIWVSNRFYPMKFCLCVLGLNMLHHATFCAVLNSDDFGEEVRNSDIGPTFFTSYSVDLLRFHTQRIKRNNVLSDLLLEWKRISHPLLKTYSFVTASTSIPCGFIIQLSQAERSTLERLHCTVFFLKRSSSRVSVGHLLSDDLV